MKKQVIYTTVVATLSVILAAACGYFFCTGINVDDAELYVLIPLYIISLFIGAFVDVLVHEGAHLLVGAICRMGMKAPKIRLFRSSSVDVYPTGAKGIKGRMIATSLAGCFFDLLLVALGAIALLVPSVSVIFATVLPYAFYSFALNIAPLEYASGKTDGLVAWELITDKPTAQVMLAVLKVQGLVHSGVLLADVDEGLLLDVPQLPEDDINFIIITQLRYEYYLAKGNDSEAYKYFARYQELIQYLPEGYKK